MTLLEAIEEEHRDTFKLYSNMITEGNWNINIDENEVPLLYIDFIWT